MRVSRRKRQIGEAPTPSRRAIRPGRQSIPKWGSAFGMMPYTYIPRRQYEQYDISKLENSYLTASQLLALLPDLSSDVGLALWNVLRLGTAGFEYKVLDLSGNEDEAAKELLDNLMSRINERSGGVDGLIAQWFSSAFLQGGVCGEVALTEDMRDVDDFICIDPYSIKFNRNEEGKLVAFHIPPSSTMRIEMNPEKFWYIPVDPWIDDPYGRAPSAPVLQEVWFDISVITDLRKVVHNQGWPRIDIKILEEVLVNNAPMGIKNDPQKLRDWLDDRLRDVQTAYNELEPDDSFVHFDSVEIGQAASSGKLFDATAVMRVIERRMIKALKQLPILMASNEGTTETHGIVQWQIYVNGLKTFRKPVAFILSKMMELALQVWGIQGRVECSFEEIRTTDRKAEAEAEKIEIANAIDKWKMGWISWEDSAVEITGSAPPDASAEPDRNAFMGGFGAQQNANQNSEDLRDPFIHRLRDELELYPDG